MNKIRAVIIDDEEQSRLLLKIALSEYTTDIDLVGEGCDVESGLDIIKAQEPNLVFLDIDLFDGTGFDILDKLINVNFNIIFFTAYNEYAIRAIRYSAFDYLLKPLDLEELEKAINRIKLQQCSQSVNSKFLKQQLQQRNKENNSLIIPMMDSYELLLFEHIIAIQANGNYVVFILENNKKHLVAKSLNHYEDLLPQSTFYRIHKSHMININKLTSIESGRTGKAHLSNGMILDIAARRKAHFIAIVKMNRDLNRPQSS